MDRVEGSTGGRSFQEAVVARYRRALLEGGSPDPGLLQELNQLFAAEWDRVFAVCRRFLGDAERAQDLAQDTLLRAFDRLDQYRGQASFRTWLYAIARSLCLRALRQRAELLLEDGILDRADPAAGVLKRLDAGQREALIREAIGEVLTPEEQEVVYLRYVELIPQERITDILGLDSASGARGLLQRCRRKLQRELRQRLALWGHGSSFVRETL